jgi:hypothetical protein
MVLKTYPFHALLHCRYLYSKLTKRRPWDEVKGIDMGHQQLVGTVMAIVNVHTRCVCVEDVFTYVGRNHSGTNS